MKKIIALSLLLLTFSSRAHAWEGSWIAAGGSFEHVANGQNMNGVGATVEGGYWYLGNVAYGGYVKSSFMGKIGGVSGTNLNIYDMGVFWKAATEAGLYGKILAGLAFISPSGNYTGLRAGAVTSFSLGAGGGFLFSLSDNLQIGPEVIYRHLTAGDGADQISVGGLVAYTF